MPSDAIKIDHPSAQLADGETQGSRHCLDDVRSVTQYRLVNPTVLEGNVIDAPAGMLITHPEHGDMAFAPGVYQIGYQRQYAEELRRVLD